MGQGDYRTGERVSRELGAPLGSRNVLTLDLERVQMSFGNLEIDFLDFLTIREADPRVSEVPTPWCGCCQRQHGFGAGEREHSQWGDWAAWPGWSGFAEIP